MRFLNVEAVLNTDKCTRQAGHETDKTTDYGVNPDVEILKGLGHQFTSYAILSHCWGDEKDEVKFEEMNGLAVMETHKKDDVKGRNGYKKIIKSCEQAMKDGYRWLWIDTCCIDKRSSAELTEAINSMYRWYRDSQMCYVYLNDVDDSALPTKQDFSKPGWVNGWPKWFSRGWTLQELIAPREAIFFNKRWESIGTKGDLTFVLKGITRIPDNVLRYEWVLRSIGTDRPLIAHIMSWAADRETTRVEDRAYSLLGLFDVNMPMLYGEGLKAFQRLQLEIIRVSSDHSIFAWNPKGRLGKNRSVLADDPSCFRECHDTETEDLSWFAEEARQDIRWDWWRSVDPTRLLRFDVTNLGIQLSLPVFPNYSDSSSKSKFTDDSSTIPEDDETEVKYYTAMLPCRDGNRNLITIDLQRDGYKWCSSRSFWPPRIPNRATRPEFRSLYLNCLQHAEESYRSFRFHDKRTSYYGFSRCGAFPQKITDDTVTVSQGKNLFILVYARDKPKSRFAVGLGYYLGEVWARIVCDESSAYQEVWSLGADEFAKQVYNILWKAPIKDHPLLYIRQLTVLKNAHITTNAHLPGTIWNATIVHTTEDKGTDIVVGIEQCPGCCIGPRELHSAFPYELTWISSTIGFHELELEGKRVRFDECFHQKITVSCNGVLGNCGRLTQTAGRLWSLFPWQIRTRWQHTAGPWY
ncbi:heterokaryon incompatibility protein-domain-containing protein [Pisolithus orientalis]|uniref:heterokaryon incompatibility protein-domain-containing protein n=1 Tax=Pisolithus orientalis TaxID=936130 RepID=UPI002225B496|nr:heterokaryon incompatibility protein-domain-containing protein [Pisolithus orientalis]KAI6002301.1 heterokaryon incompatibility protein-domain-containing protein [Pisolithus orientalis]